MSYITITPELPLLFAMEMKERAEDKILHIFGAIDANMADSTDHEALLVWGDVVKQSNRVIKAIYN